MFNQVGTIFELSPKKVKYFFSVATYEAYICEFHEDSL